MYGIIGVFPLHALYPLMKRWTWWPQAWLGRLTYCRFQDPLTRPIRFRSCHELGIPGCMDFRHWQDGHDDCYYIFPRDGLVRSTLVWVIEQSNEYLCIYFKLDDSLRHYLRLPGSQGRYDGGRKINLDSFR